MSIRTRLQTIAVTVTRSTRLVQDGEDKEAEDKNPKGSCPETVGEHSSDTDHSPSNDTRTNHFVSAIAFLAIAASSESESRLRSGRESAPPAMNERSRAVSSVIRVRFRLVRA